MELKIIKRSEAKVSGWSGGTTTEWLIWPLEAHYSKRDFQCRISTAKVELPESLFTPLLGVHRFLTPLDAPLTLTHNAQISLVLQPLQVHEFPGDWQTLSRGQTQDLNLMLRGVPGTMTHLAQPQDFSIGGNQHLTLDAFYFTQPGSVQTKDETLHLQRDELLVLLSSPEDSPTTIHLEAANIIHMQVKLPPVV